jgi:hypothetical protein
MSLGEFTPLEMVVPGERPSAAKTNQMAQAVNEIAHTLDPKIIVAPPSARNRRGRDFVAIITGTDGNGNYSWVEQRIIGNTGSSLTWLADPLRRGVSPDSSSSGAIPYSARELNGSNAVAANTAVIMYELFDAPNSMVQYVFSLALSGFFPVRVWQDGGTTDGDVSTKCNRTYTVRTMNATAIDTGGVLLGEDKTPDRVRPTVGLMLVPSATGGGVVGVGYYVGSSFYLYDANETAEQEDCVEE